MKSLRFTLVFALLLMFPFQTFSQDVIKEWNTIAVNMTLTASPAQSPQQQTRTMAIYSAAVHDAVNGITGEYETYLSPGAAPEKASAEAAAIAASYRALCGLFGTTACTNLQPTFLLRS